MIKLSVNETKWSSLLARTRALILYISIWIFVFWPEKLAGLSRNGPQFQDSLECFSLIGRKTIEGQHLSRCFRDLLIRRSLPANSTVFPSPKQKEQQELSSRRVLVRFPYNPIHYIMHIRFDYVHNNAICEKKYEIVASITNVWG